jgi:low temperature requirement protein LtrA
VLRGGRRPGRGGLHHAAANDHLGDGVLGYAMVFFAIWWAWMNFTWFASAYDTDDIPYRLTTLVQIAGALILAAGVPVPWTATTSR